jgi:DNA-binding NarL/FixJ family response regulator
MNIVIIDDDALVSEALRTILEADSDVKVLALGKDGADALPLYEKFRPDVLLMDIRMKNMTGIEAGEEVLSRHPDARILFLTTFSDDDYVIKALRMGAKGYLLKQKFESIIPSLKAVMAEQSVFGEEIIARLPLFRENSQKKTPSLEEYKLTPRELEILALIAEGLSNKEIAEQLFISEGTVRNAISLLLEKLRLKSRTQLAIFYLKNTSETR